MTPYIVQIGTALDAAGIPYLGIDTDPATGAVTVTYAPSATQAQITQGNSIVAQWTNPTPTTLQQAQRSPAIAWLNNVELSGVACLLRAILVEVVKQLNVLRDRCASQDSAVAAAASLADLKSRWAALAAAAPLAGITKAQVISALQGDINAGSGDTTTS